MRIARLGCFVSVLTAAACSEHPFAAMDASTEASEDSAPAVGCPLFAYGVICPADASDDSACGPPNVVGVADASFPVGCELMKNLGPQPDGSCGEADFFCVASDAGPMWTGP